MKARNAASWNNRYPRKNGNYYRFRTTWDAIHRGERPMHLRPPTAHYVRRYRLRAGKGWYAGEILYRAHRW